jgi:hypothetical protein
VKERPIHYERPVPPLDYEPDDRENTGPVPVSFAFLVGFLIGFFIMTPILLLAVAAFVWLT